MKSRSPYIALMEHPAGVHLLITAFMGKTADCLREHGIEPTDDVRENARLHLALHNRLAAAARTETP